ncbi:MAG: RNA-guided endonuclease InsQ/TnpB family protein [Bacillota bacterium]
MKRTSVLLLLPSKAQARTLATVADRAAALWNCANYRCRQGFAAGGHVPAYEALCHEFVSHSAYRALPSDVAQETLKKLAAAWRSFFALRRAFGQGKLERKPRPPRYWKDRKTGQRLSRGVFVKSPRSFSVSRKALALALPSDLRKGPGDRLVIQTRGQLRYAGELKTCELQRDSVTRRWYAHITVETPEPVRATRPEKWAGIDLNARILAAAAVEDNQLVRLYRGREIWREFLYWTRRIAREQARLAQQGVRTSRPVRRLYRRRRLRLLHALQALARQVAVGLRRSGVTDVALEDLTGIREHMDFGPGNLLVHNFWAFARWRRTLEAALGRVGIRVVAVEARGTSSRCAVCGQPVARPVRHKVVCRHCGTVFHADANAARNILYRAAGFQAPSKGDGAEAKAPAPLALRWDRHRWVPTGAKSAAANASRDSRAA